MAGKQRSAALQAHLDEYLVDRILHRSIVPTPVRGTSIRGKMKKDPQFLQKTKAQYEETLAGPFPKGPWPSKQPKFGWVTFTMDDKSAARLKHREFRHDEKVPFKKSSQFQVDLDIDQEDVVFSGHFEQVYVETKDGKKKIAKSVWNAEISAMEWHDKMYLPYHKNWRRMNKSRGAIIKTVQKFLHRQASGENAMNILANVCALPQHDRVSRTATKARAHLSFFFFCAHKTVCPMQGKFASIGAQVDEVLAGLFVNDSSDSDADSEADEKAAEKAAAEKAAAEKVENDVVMPKLCM